MHNFFDNLCHMKGKQFHLIILLVAVLFSACSKSTEQQQHEQRAERQRQQALYEAAFKVGVMPTLDCLPIYLLKDSLLYDTTKVDIRLLVFNAQMDCDTALVGGSVQASITDVVRAERLKRNHLALTYFSATNNYWVLVANKKARVKTLPQLSDKMIAMTRFSATDMLTDMALKQGKPKYDSYKVQINDILLRTKMIVNNEMDAAWFAEPQATQLLALGHNVLFDSRKQQLQLGAIVLRTADIVMPQREKQLNEFTKAYNRACDELNSRGLKYYRELIKRYMNVDDATIDRLPKLKFMQAVRPNQSDIDKAQAFLH